MQQVRVCAGQSGYEGQLERETNMSCLSCPSIPHPHCPALTLVKYSCREATKGGRQAAGQVSKVPHVARRLHTGVSRCRAGRRSPGGGLKEAALPGWASRLPRPPSPPARRRRPRPPPLQWWWSVREGGGGRGGKVGRSGARTHRRMLKAQSVGLVKLLGICLHHTQRLPYPLDASTYPPTCCTTGTSTVPTRVSVTPVPVAPSV